MVIDNRDNCNRGKMGSLSICIIVLNESDKIRDCLENIRGLGDELIVVDQFSMDGTLDICKEYTDHVYQYLPTGGFADSRNYADSKARGEWIFWLDADERLDGQLKAEILSVLDTTSVHDAYYVQRINYIFGKWMLPERHIRLYRKCDSIWVGKVHESIRVVGSIGRLRHEIRHFSHPNISTCMNKINLYSTLEAEQLFEKDPAGIGLLRLLYVTVESFLYKIIKINLLKDGIHGFIWVVLASVYQFITRAKHWEMAYRAKCEINTR